MKRRKPRCLWGVSRDSHQATVKVTVLLGQAHGSKDCLRLWLRCRTLALHQQVFPNRFRVCRLRLAAQGLGSRVWGLYLCICLLILACTSPACSSQEAVLAGSKQFGTRNPEPPKPPYLEGLLYIALLFPLLRGGLRMHSAADHLPGTVWGRPVLGRVGVHLGLALKPFF